MRKACDLAAATAMRARAGKLYRRALEYGLRGIEVDHPGFREALRHDPGKAVAAVRSQAEVPLLYWTAMAWGAAVSLAKENPDLAAGLPATEALVRRAIALDEGFGAGALYDFLIAYDGGRPASAGGSAERARADLEKATGLGGRQAGGPSGHVRGDRVGGFPGPRGVQTTADAGARDRRRPGAGGPSRQPRRPETRSLAARPCRRALCRVS